jgi:hypothetical protein
MNRVSTARFRKLRTCPSTEVLIQYGQAGLACETEERVSRHLASCDFCGAEMQFLSKHWRRDLPVLQAAGDMSLSLRCLAEDLLTNLPAFNRARFAETICDIERLPVSDAV